MAIPPPSPIMNWKTTDLTSVPLSTNKYDYIIPGLSGNTVYQYRSYMVVDGQTYVGDTCQIATASVVTSPIVSTGCAVGVTYDGMCIGNSCVVSNGNTSISEYGVLYTQNPSLGTSEYLINTNTCVCRKTMYCNIQEGVGYFCYSTCAISNLQPNTETFYRAYAINSIDSSHGCVKTVQTCSIPTTLIDVCLYRVGGKSSADSCGFVRPDPIIPMGESMIVDLAIEHCAIDYGSATTELFCKPTGALNYVSVCLITTTSSDVSDYCYISTCFTASDSMCYTHSVNSNDGSFASICGSVTYSTPYINPIMNSTYYCDKVENIPYEYL